MLNSSREKKLYVDLFYDLGKCYNHDGMVSAPESEILAYIEMMRKEPVYRLNIQDDGSVLTDCYDLLENFNPELKKAYECIDELPKWVQDKLAVLLLLDYNKNNKDIPNIGRRITKNIFWVYTRDGEVDGDDPRG
jgi:hypothetical protein